MHAAEKTISTRPSLRRFLLGRVMLWIMPLLAFSMALHWSSEYHLIKEMFDLELGERAKVLASLITSDRGAVELDFADEYMPEYSAGGGDYYFQIWDPNGRELERSRSLGEVSLPLQFGSLDEPSSFTAVGPRDVALHCVGIRFPRRSSSGTADGISQVDIVVAAHDELLDTRLREGLFEVLWGGLLTAAGVALAVFLALRQGIILIEEVVQTVESIDPENLGRPIPLQTVPAELQPIVHALNRSMLMTSEILDQERSFNENVAHELRTPISELRTLTDVALRYPEQIDALETVRESNEVSRNMGRTVESLLQLSRIQARELELDSQPFDLVRLIEAGVLTATGQFTEKDRVALTLPDSCALTSGASLWTMIVHNLATNAFEYSPPDSRVVVALQCEPSLVRLSIRNQAPGLTDAELKHLTERLWRGRPQALHANHSGLGLSIVSAACTRLGARLSFELNAGELTAEVAQPTRERPSN